MLVDQYGRPFESQAPAFVGRADSPGFQPHEVCKVDMELIPPDETSTKVLEEYWAPPGKDPMHEPAGMARRYWSIEHKLLVGGVILDVSDAMHLARDYGITHVLSFDDEHSDDGKWGQNGALDAGGRACIPWTLGQPADLLTLRRGVRWLKQLPPEAVVYAHGRLGHMRGACAAYLVLRVRHRLSREDAQRRSGRGPACPDHPWGAPLQVNFLFHIDRAIREAEGG